MKKSLKSFYYAWLGLKRCALKERNFRIQLIGAAAVIFVSTALHISSMEWLIILICTGSVLCLEMINTALEHLCNVISTDFHAGIKTIKDIAAGAVLLCAFVSLVCGAIIFIPKII